MVFQKYFQVGIQKCYNELELSNYDLTYSMHLVPIAKRIVGKSCFPLRGLMLILLLVSSVVNPVTFRYQRKSIRDRFQMSVTIVTESINLYSPVKSSANNRLSNDFRWSRN